MKKISVLILTGLLSLSVFAQSDWYGGIGVVKSSWDESISGINFEYDKANVKVFTGVKLENNFAVEFQYVNFAKDDIASVSGVSKIAIGTIPVGTDITISAEAEASSFGGALLYNFTPESDISAFVKVGIHAWNMDSNALVTSAAATETSAPISDDGTDLFYGVGVDIKTTDSITTRIDYERFEFDDDDIDNFGVSVVFSF